MKCELKVMKRDLGDCMNPYSIVAITVMTLIVFIVLIHSPWYVVWSAPAISVAAWYLVSRKECRQK